MKHFIDEPISLLEIGIANGDSLRMWRDYFLKATIYGLDINDKRQYAEERIRIHHGSQADPVTIARIIADCPNGFDVIVDDGSHRSEHGITTLHMLWPSLKDNGWYIIEDLQTSYWAMFGGNPQGVGQQTMLDYLQSLVHSLNWQEIHRPRYEPSLLDTTLVGMHFYHNMVFLQKGNNREGSNVLKDNIMPNTMPWEN